MASYTDNYALTKPTMAESADIRVINSNMDTVDDVMHSTQISLAPAYDMHETYNTGDVVMYEMLMYECLEDEVTGVWDATKWQRTTAGQHGGGGGSDVSITPTLQSGTKIAEYEIDGVGGELFAPTGGGGGDANYEELTQQEYDALTTAEKMNGTMYFITDGQNDGGDAYFYPMLYSEEEREVGTWIDGKPLYAKSFTGTISSNPQSVDASSLNISEIAKWEATISGFSGGRSFILYNSTNLDSDRVNTDFYDGNFRMHLSSYYFGYTYAVTLFYTKTTDVAGSGKYNTLGVPNHHYDGTEKIVGTWFGETLYQVSETGSFSTGTLTALTLSDDIDTLVSYEAAIYYPPTNQWLHIPYFEGSDRVYLITNDNLVKIVSNSGMSAYTKYVVTVKYTKSST